jgi:hypothetical protein
MKKAPANRPVLRVGQAPPDETGFGVKNCGKLSGKA